MRSKRDLYYEKMMILGTYILIGKCGKYMYGNDIKMSIARDL